MPQVLSLPGDALAADADGRPVLIGCVCGACGNRMFPSAPVCPMCMSEDIACAAMPRGGSLYSFTVLHVGPNTWKKPFTVGYVDLDNGVRVFTHLCGTEFQIDQPVELAVAEIGKTPEGKPIVTSVFQRARA
jgi:uncharacterized OB-fold protein